MRYMRFVYGDLIDGVGYRSGFLDAAYRLRNTKGVETATVDLLNEMISWFKQHLPVPDSFNRSSSKAAYRKNTKGLSWFKTGATLHITKAYEVLAVLNEYDILTEVLRTNHPGYIVYEDEWQVVAEPFSDTPT